jgi:hypothetical protein
MFFTEVINVDKDGLSTRFWSNETKPFIIIPRGYFSLFKCHILVPMANPGISGGRFLLGNSEKNSQLNSTKAPLNRTK